MLLKFSFTESRGQKYLLCENQKQSVSKDQWCDNYEDCLDGMPYFFSDLQKHSFRFFVFQDLMKNTAFIADRDLCIENFVFWLVLH